MNELDIIGPDDRPALLAISAPDVLVTVKTTLGGMGYKVHSVEDLAQFEHRFNQINYQIAVIEETFAGSTLSNNPTLRLVQNLPMSIRRHAVIFLLGQGMKTLDTMQAFAQSVHCVVNYSELVMLPDLVRKTVTENDLFLHTFRDVRRRVYQKAI